MKDIGIEFCDNKEIFYIWDDGEYYLINGSDGYLKKDWCWRTPLSITSPTTPSVNGSPANGTHGAADNPA